MTEPHIPSPRRLGLFQAAGLEFEYMIVDADLLSVRGVADQLLRGAGARQEADADRGEFAWSNELVLHVIEIKTHPPAASLSGLDARVQAEVQEINRRLHQVGCRLMPTAMHPWMNPLLETRLWPHDGSPIYRTFDRIFGCQGHGWSNLQSLHLNLPFSGDAEFGRLHAAIRLLLPLIPALAASSPFVEGAATGYLDNRLRFYQTNCARIPSVTGAVIPEPVFTAAEYQERILQPMYEAIAAHDPEGVLQEEWLNARGAIARFDRDTIEIRLIDVQECPRADLAVAAACLAVVKSLAQERHSSLSQQQAIPTAPLAALLSQTIQNGDQAIIGDTAYLEALGLRGHPSLTAGALWRRLLADLIAADIDALHQWREPLDLILRRGPLARHLLNSIGSAPTKAALHDLYRRLCDHLEADMLFDS